ncbi:MAG: hypothetical protein QNJ55_10990 [Xenococcus sp. MO_188.B8]|nr:hypothetical protein [Xenococcus sp. MO_188.B8]
MKGFTKAAIDETADDNEWFSAQKETTAKGEGFEARRITVTHADGQETHRVVWVDNEQEKQVEQLVEEVMNVLPKDPQLQQAVLTKPTERILHASSG